MGTTVWFVRFPVNIDHTINMAKSKSAWISAAEASSLLGVTRATLYAYVSRGHIRSDPGTGTTRHRRYSREDAQRLRARASERRNPRQAAGQALQWGLPVLESAITLIADGHLYYRGRDCTELANAASIAETAALLWTGTADGSRMGSGALPARIARRGGELPFVARAQVALAQAACADPLAFDLRPRQVTQTGWRILHLLAAVAAEGGAPEASIDATLARHWRAPAAQPLLRAALILCADHELNVSSFTARCVASAGGSPYGVVIAGLAALEGIRHGGTTGRVEILWDSLRQSRDLRSALAARLRHGEELHGFGHPLYPDGDPRAKALLSMLPKCRETAFALRLASEVAAVLEEQPTVDFALVALRRALGLAQGTALTLFALGRTMGWIGHCIEQYAGGSFIRPRASYTGQKPAGAATTP
jgi:citrate synthase